MKNGSKKNDKLMDSIKSKTLFNEFLRLAD
jgi:hypothetical protein